MQCMYFIIDWDDIDGFFYLFVCALRFSLLLLLFFITQNNSNFSFVLFFFSSIFRRTYQFPKNFCILLADCGFVVVSFTFSATTSFLVYWNRIVNVFVWPFSFSLIIVSFQLLVAKFTEIWFSFFVVSEQWTHKSPIYIHLYIYIYVS